MEGNVINSYWPAGRSIAVYLLSNHGGNLLDCVEDSMKKPEHKGLFVHEYHDKMFTGRDLKRRLKKEKEENGWFRMQKS